MTKAELVEDVAEAAELTKKDAERLVEIVFESIIETLNQGEKIELRGFGSFRVRERGARRGRNPKTGDPVSIPAKRVPYFKPGKELKERCFRGFTPTSCHVGAPQTQRIQEWTRCGVPGVTNTSPLALRNRYLKAAFFVSFGTILTKTKQILLSIVLLTVSSFSISTLPLAAICS